MYRRPRIIPCLLVSNRDMVKTIKFNNPRYLGDVVNAVKIFNNKGVDELAILDITASKDGKVPDINFLKDIAREAFMPLSYGGGITKIEQVRELFAIGYEKVIINTSLVKNPEFIKEAVEYAGSQSIAASIDVKSDFWGRTACYVKDGTEKINIRPIELAKQAVQLGVGEILLNAINNDGLMKGYDINLVKSIADAVTVPVIACGGAGNVNDLKIVLEEGHAHAAAAGSLFVYYGENKAILITAPSEQQLTDAGIYIND